MQFCKVATMFGLKGCEEKFDQALMEEFVGHTTAFGLSYGTKEEFEFRFQLYEKKDKLINEHNAKDGSFALGHNQFSTWTSDEYKRILGFKAQGTETKEPTVLDVTDLPASVDWRSKGAVNAIKDQSACGSCWAFSATCAVEGAHFLKSGTLVSLSEQQLVDCDTVDKGCDGGWQSGAFNYLEKNSQDTEADYSYSAPMPSTCVA